MFIFSDVACLCDLGCLYGMRWSLVKDGGMLGQLYVLFNGGVSIVQTLNCMTYQGVKGVLPGEGEEDGGFQTYDERYKFLLTFPCVFLSGNQ